MASVVITLIGDDQAGLVDAVAEVVAKHGGNWGRSTLAELAGKFAGIVQIDIAEAAVEDLLNDLETLEAQGLLAITAERATSSTSANTGLQATLELTGQDHPGIVHEISQLLSQTNVSIDELETTVTPAPQGGNLFIANAVLALPAGLSLDELSVALEALADDLMVDLDLIADL